VGPRKRTLLLRLSFVALLLGQQSVFALLAFDGNRNQVFVFGSAALAYDSNLFAQPGGASDVTETFTVGADLNRKAGLITLSATAAVAFVRYDRHTNLNAVNPNLLVNLEKASGRLTGSLMFNPYRTEQADSAVNLHTTSWNVPVTLSLRYPINERFYVTSQSAWQERRYEDSGLLLHNYDDFAEGVDGYYTYTSKLDLLAGYRVRWAHTDLERSVDQNFSVGATGALLPKLNGLVRVGYQQRQVRGNASSFSQLSASGQLTWNASRKLSVTALLSKDFNTAATAVSVDSLAASLNASYAMTRRLQFEAGLGFGRNRFLDQGEDGRLDDFFSCNAGASYNLNERFKVSGAYSYFRNSSNLALAGFDREQYSVNLTGRF